MTAGVGAVVPLLLLGLTLHLITRCDAAPAVGLNSESDEFSSWPNERDASEKVPELDAFEFLRVWGVRVDDEDDDMEGDLASIVGGTSVDEATIVVEAGVLRGFGAVVVPVIFEIEEERSDGETLAELMIDERRPLLVLPCSSCTPCKEKNSRMLGRTLPCLSHSGTLSQMKIRLY